MQWTIDTPFPQTPEKVYHFAINCKKEPIFLDGYGHLWYLRRKKKPKWKRFKNFPTFLGADRIYFPKNHPSRLYISNPRNGMSIQRIDLITGKIDVILPPHKYGDWKICDMVALENERFLGFASFSSAQVGYHEEDHIHTTWFELYLGGEMERAKLHHVMRDWPLPVVDIIESFAIKLEPAVNFMQESRVPMRNFAKIPSAWVYDQVSLGDKEFHYPRNEFCVNDTQAWTPDECTTRKQTQWPFPNTISEDYRMIKGHEKIVFELVGDDFRQIGRNASENQKIARLKWTGLGIFASVRVKFEPYATKFKLLWLNEREFFEEVDLPNTFEGLVPIVWEPNRFTAWCILRVYHPYQIRCLMCRIRLK